MTLEQSNLDELWVAIGELTHRLADIELWAKLVSREMAKDDVMFSPPNDREEF